LDRRFWWNSFGLKPLAGRPELQPWMLPLVQGYVHINVCKAWMPTSDAVALSNNAGIDLVASHTLADGA